MYLTSGNFFKYVCTKLNPKSTKFKFLKRNFDTTLSGTNREEFTNFQIFKLVETNPNKVVNEKRKNLMLFHGTNKKGAMGILKKGFKNSSEGWFGRGVYMTDCSDVAFNYSYTDEITTRYSCIFLNEVLESEKLQTFEFNLKDIEEKGWDINTKPNHQFEKHIFKSSTQPSKEDYKMDNHGRLYRNTPIRENSRLDQYIAEASLTIPRYLFVFSCKYLLK